MNSNPIFSGDVSLGQQISEKEFKELVYTKLQEILKRVFPDNPTKQKIKIAPDRFQFACPFCRDSSKSNSKKRGNFIFKPGQFYNCYKCFNCGEYMTIQKFFKEFDSELPLNAIDYISTHKVNFQRNTNGPVSEYQTVMFNADLMDKLAVDKNWFITWFGLEYIGMNTRCGKYLQRRCIENFDNFLYDPKNDSLIIMNLINNKVISFQIRPLKEKKYITVSLKMIHQKLLKDNIEVPDDLESLSMIFNLYNVNPYKPLLATEGPIDSMFLPNCIALLGAAKSVNIGYPLWYVFDSDTKGREEAIKRLNKGSYVFMWEKLKTKYNLPNQNKWDVNDFIIWCKKHQTEPPRYWREYFTNDVLDGMLML